MIPFIINRFLNIVLVLVLVVVCSFDFWFSYLLLLHSIHVLENMNLFYI